MTILILGLHCLVTHFSHVSAAPTSNKTALQTEYAQPWVPDPGTRGTWSLLYSCLFTLGLCVWSAIHLNIPPRGELPVKQFLRKTKWVFIAIFAPELVLFSAWQQLYTANEFCKEANMIHPGRVNNPTNDRGQSDGSHTRHASRPQNPTVPCAGQSASGKQTNEEKKPDRDVEQGRSTPIAPFSLTLGFYVVMGGFTVDVSDMYDTVDTLTLTPEGVLYFLRRGWMTGSEISTRAIRDKSKADYLGKGLVVLQVTWMCLQSISRKASGLPLSVLEIHTLVHSFCALLMFLMWWNKPLDIRDATVLSTADFVDELALIAINTSFDDLKSGQQVIVPDCNRGIDGDAGVNECLRVFPEIFLGREAHLLLYAPKSREITQSFVPANGIENVATCHVGQTSPAQRYAASLTKADRESADIVVRDRNINARDIQASELSGTIVCPRDRAKAERLLITGEVLPSGVGPSYVSCKVGPRKHSHNDRTVLNLWRREYTTRLVPISPMLKSKLPVNKEVLELRSSFTRYLECQISMQLSQKDIIRYHRGASAMGQRKPDLKGDQPTQSLLVKDYPRDCCIYRSKNIVDVAVGSFFKGLMFESRTEGLMSCSLLVLGTVYAGVHLALWDYRFPTRVESLLWKISATSLAGLPALYVLFGVFIMPVVWLLKINYITYARRKMWLDKVLTRRRHRWAITQVLVTVLAWSLSLLKLTRKSCSWISDMLESVTPEIVFDILLTIVYTGIIILAGFAILLYGFGRVYIVVESFISLRRVPVGVYGAVNWAQYIPHL